MSPTLIFDLWLGRVVAHVRGPLAEHDSIVVVHSARHRPNQHAVRKIGLFLLPVGITAHMQVLFELFPEVVVTRLQITVRVLQLIAHFFSSDHAILQFVHVHFPLIIFVS